MVEEHIVHDHTDGGSGAYMFLAFIVVLVVVGLLLWRFLPVGGENRQGIDVNITGGETGGTNQGY